jgi:hypothetical protein
VSNGAVEVGRRIAMLRQRLGLSQVAFARQAGISRRLPSRSSASAIPEASNALCDGSRSGRVTIWSRLATLTTWPRRSVPGGVPSVWYSFDVGVVAQEAMSPRLAISIGAARHTRLIPLLSGSISAPRRDESVTINSEVASRPPSGASRISGRKADTWRVVVWSHS